MKHEPIKRFFSAALAAALVLGLGGCGGGGQEAVVGKLIVFGDSLSDVGTYRVSTIAQLGGGQYTVNGPGFRNWTEQLALDLGVKRPCAAQTGLMNSAIIPPPTTPTNHADCLSYAQGGARVTADHGPGNAALNDAKGQLGALTVPVKSQIDRYLGTHQDRFAVSDLVTVWAGANDLFIQLDRLKAAQTDVAGARAAMTGAGTELAGYVKALLLAKGAQHVVVMTLPDASLTPLGRALDPTNRALVLQMTADFNAALANGLSTAGERVMLVDVFSRSQEQYANRAQLGNFEDPACNLAIQALPTSLVCTQATLIAGDTSRHFYADDVHPTPYGHGLIADFVLERMRSRGWR